MKIESSELPFVPDPPDSYKDEFSKVNRYDLLENQEEVFKEVVRNLLNKGVFKTEINSQNLIEELKNPNSRTGMKIRSMIQKQAVRAEAILNLLIKDFKKISEVNRLRLIKKYLDKEIYYEKKHMEAVEKNNEITEDIKEDMEEIAESWERFNEILEEHKELLSEEEESDFSYAPIALDEELLDNDLELFGEALENFFDLFRDEEIEEESSLDFELFKKKVQSLLELEHDEQNLIRDDLLLAGDKLTRYEENKLAIEQVLESFDSETSLKVLDKLFEQRIKIMKQDAAYQEDGSKHEDAFKFIQEDAFQYLDARQNVSNALSPVSLASDLSEQIIDDISMIKHDLPQACLTAVKEHKAMQQQCQQKIEKENNQQQQTDPGPSSSSRL